MGSDGTFRIWDSQTLEIRAAMRTADSSLTDVAWLPDGRRLCVTSLAGSMYLYEFIAGA